MKVMHSHLCLTILSNFSTYLLQCFNSNLNPLCDTLQDVHWLKDQCAVYQGLLFSFNYLDNMLGKFHTKLIISNYRVSK